MFPSPAASDQFSATVGAVCHQKKRSKNPNPRKDYTSLRFAEVIVDFMDSLHIRQASLVATDIALLPSLLVGLEHPSRVSKLAVMDGIPFPRPQHSSWELKSFAKKGSILGKALVRWFPRVTAQISYLKGFPAYP